MDGHLGSGVPAGTQDEPHGSSGMSDVQMLRQELLNEKLAPQLLPFKSELTLRIRDQLEEQDKVLDDIDGDPNNLLAAQMYGQEKARVTWLLKEYYRVRLRKLERHAVAYIKAMKDEEEQAVNSGLLSEQEKQFLEQYFLAVGRHFRSLVLHHLPDDYQSLVKSHKSCETEDMIDAPVIGRHVFCRVLQDIGRVIVSEEGLEVTFNAGDIYVVRYDFIAELLASGRVALV